MVASMSYNSLALKIEGDYYVYCLYVVVLWALNLYCPVECHVIAFVASFF